MKWYSTKKYKAPDDLKLIVRMINVNGYAEYGSAQYCSETGLFLLSLYIVDHRDSFFEVTHFCIPDPIEIEE